ncbi:hypothetical protein IV37_GL000170 [Fructilactobacillus fructivorans]|uniref:hypothetical protein n=1 Tax=Fructilactobacillus fructivorans TaxID=1614 RepID=UPI000704D113|nr:hypothetical protein [Fructilactobacillus fructivorans]KRN13449.1 hypothetical protein IV37_GL000170 [Fructilactobacillus fructivorans]
MNEEIRKTVEETGTDNKLVVAAQMQQDINLMQPDDPMFEYSQHHQEALLDALVNGFKIKLKKL